MAVSVSGVRSAVASTRPMNYSISNQSQVSDSFAESINNTSANAVDASSPVVYANSQRTTSGTVNATSQAQEVQRVSKAMNDIAEGFGGNNTSYSANMQAQKYDVIGSNFDMYA